MKKFILPNGLKVLVHEDKSTPMAVVNVLYDVGARDENPGNRVLDVCFRILGRIPKGVPYFWVLLHLEIFLNFLMGFLYESAVSNDFK